MNEMHYENIDNSLKEDDSIFIKDNSILKEYAYSENQHEVDYNDTNDSQVEINIEDVKLRNYFYDFEIPSISLDDIQFENSIELKEITDEFSNDKIKVGVNISKVPKSIVLEGKYALEKAMMNDNQNIISKEKEFHKNIIFREQQSRDRLFKREQDSRKRLEEDEKKLKDFSLLQHQRITNQLKKAREDIEHYFRGQNAEVREAFGDIQTNPNYLSNHHVIILNSKLPQPLEIRIHMLRAVKSKLPKGAYVLMISQYDSLGGNPLFWSSYDIDEIGKVLPRVTKPVKHFGRYHDRVMSFEDSCFTICPPKSKLSPSFCLIFELFQVANNINPYDKCVGWGAIPMCNEHFGITTGKFRIPLVKGNYSSNIKLYLEMEELIANNLDNWLCNMYFEMRLLRIDVLKNYFNNDYINEKKTINFDYFNRNIITETSEVENEFSDLLKSNNSNSKNIALLPTPSLMNSLNEKDGNESSSSSINEIDEIFGIGTHNRKSGSKVEIEAIEHDDDNIKSNSHTKKTIKTFWESLFGNKIDKDSIHSDDQMNLIPKKYKKHKKYRQVHEKGFEENIDFDFDLNDDEKGKLIGNDALSSYYDPRSRNRNVYRYQSEGLKFDSISLKDNEKNQQEDYKEGFQPNQGWKTIEETQDIELYTMSISSDIKHSIVDKLHLIKLRYLSYEIFGDLFALNLQSFSFYIIFVFFAFALWWRIYIHYISQYLYLYSIKTSVFELSPSVIEVIIKYIPSTISITNEVGLITIGTIFNILFFIVFSLIAKFSYSIGKVVPDSVSKFIVFYGFATILDPFLIFIVDLCYGNYNCSQRSSQCQESYISQSCQCFEGDFIKLYNQYYIREGSGISGIVITLVIDCGLMLLSSILLYEYIAHIHMNGRVQDIWRRIHAIPEVFVSPDDYEITMKDLKDICTKAEKWRGFNGQTRKIEKRQPHEEEENITEYVCIYLYSKNGEKQSLFRSFQLLENGEIHELFDQKWLGKAKLSDQKDIIDQEDQQEKEEEQVEDVKQSNTLIEETSQPHLNQYHIKFQNELN